jgi:hypothetical protein
MRPAAEGSAIAGPAAPTTASAVNTADRRMLAISRFFPVRAESYSTYRAPTFGGQGEGTAVLDDGRDVRGDTLDLSRVDVLLCIEHRRGQLALRPGTSAA